MAIAVDASVGGGVTTASTTRTVAHTCTGSNLILLVSVLINSANDWVTGITYNGVAMTRLSEENTDTSSLMTYMYYLVAPATGANNVVVTSSNSTNIFSSSASYTGVKQTSTFNDQDDATASSTAIAVTSTSTVDNSWYVSSFGCNSVPENLTVGSGTTIRTSIGGAGDYIGIVDSNAAITPVGADTMNVNSSATQGLALIGGMMGPYVAPVGPVNVKTYNGVASASTKTIDGVAMASVKTYNGIA